MRQRKQYQQQDDLLVCTGSRHSSDSRESSVVGRDAEVAMVDAHVATTQFTLAAEAARHQVVNSHAITCHSSSESKMTATVALWLSVRLVSGRSWVRSLAESYLRL